MSAASAMAGALLVVLLMWTLGSLKTRPATSAVWSSDFEVSGNEQCLCYDHVLDCSSQGKTVLLPDHFCDENPIVIDVSWNALSSVDVSCHNNEYGTVYCGMPTVLVQNVLVFLVHGNQLDTFSAYGDVYTSLRVLNLSLNRISEAQFYSLHELEVLDFSFNNLTTVPWTNISKSFPNVKELDLSHNFITLNGVDEFRYAYNLLSLHLSHNNISDFYQHGTEDLLSLQTLDLSANPLDYIQYEFSSLRSLIYLNLSNANITGLVRETFYCLEFLEILDLSRNNLTTIPKGLFGHTVALEQLDLSHNLLEKIEFKEIGDEGSTYQRCYDDNPVALPTTPLRRLGTLDLSCNGILRITEDTFPALTGLRALNLSRNAVSCFTTDALSRLAALEVLDLSHNQLFELPSGAFASCKNLISLDVTDNFLLSLGGPGTFAGLSALRELRAHWNVVSELEEGVLDPLVRLERLDLSSNVLRRLPDAAVERLTHLRWLNVSDNQLRTLPDGLQRNCRVQVFYERNELTAAPKTCSAGDRLWYFARLERAMYWPTACLPPLPWALALALAVAFAAVLSRAPRRPVLIVVQNV